MPIGKTESNHVDIIFRCNFYTQKFINELYASQHSFLKPVGAI